MMRASLRTQLLAWVLVPLAILAGLNAIASWLSARAASDLVTDRTLLASARTIAEQARAEDGRTEVLIPPAALEMFDTGAGDFVYYRVTDADGRLLAGFADVPDWPRDAATGLPNAFQGIYRGRSMRFIALDHPLAGPGLRASVTVEVGVSLNNRNALLRHLWSVGFGQQLALLATAGVFMAFGLKRGLVPLLRLRDTILARDVTSLDPFDATTVQTELQPLVTALNGQMARVALQLAAQHRFVANAAHQLRTPLTLLNVQATYALRRTGVEQATALAAIQASTTQMSRLAGQLLTLSRAEPGSRRQRADRVDLRRLVARVLDGFAEPAIAKAIDLGLEERTPATVIGDETMLGEMLVNLVDNALRYCPKGSTVTVIIDRADDTAVLSVQDNGPGLPPAEWDRVFERFYRVLGTDGDGSGLGLAIVREVAETAGGTASVRRGETSGLTVEIRLPVMPAAS